MANQTYQVNAAIVVGGSLSFGFPTGSVDTITSAWIQGGVVAYPRSLFFVPGTRVEFALDIVNTGPGTSAGPDFTADFRQRASLTFSDGTNSFVLDGIEDATEPYAWTPTNQADVDSFVSNYIAGTTCTLVMDLAEVDEVPAFADDIGDDQIWQTGIEYSLIVPDGGGGSSIPVYTVVGLPNGMAFDPIALEISGTLSAIGVGTITVTATNSLGSDDWTVDYTIRGPLLLNEFPVVGLEIDVLALLPISGLLDIYVTPIRLGNDAPIDGEMGIGSGETILSRIQRVVSGSQLRLNDNDDPVAISLNTYFSAGGDGNDLTLWIQTIRGRHSGLIAGNIASSGGGFIRITMTQDIRDLLDTFVIGERFNFALTRQQVISFPDAINDLVAIFGDNQISYSWTEPYDNNSAILRYEYTIDNGVTWTDTGSLNASFVLGSLVNDVSVTLQVRAVNAIGNAQASNAVTATPTDSVPVLPTVVDLTLDRITDVNVTLPEATGGDLPVVYSLIPIPDGLQFDASTREITGRATTIGSTEVTYRATDADGSVDETTFDITVNNLSPRSRAGSDQTVQGNETVNLDGSNSADPDGNIVSSLWEQVSGPVIQIINPTSPFASFEVPSLPTQQDIILSLTVTDNDGATNVDEITITVEQDLVPTLDPISNKVGNAGVPYSEVLPLGMGGNTPLVYMLGGVLPPGMSFNENTRLLSGTPTVQGCLQSVVYGRR